MNTDPTQPDHSLNPSCDGVHPSPTNAPLNGDQQSTSLLGHDFVRKFLKSSVWISIGTFTSVALHFISISLMTRFATKETLGLYFLILAIANGGKIFASLGLDLTLVRFLVSEEEHIQQQTFAAIIWTRILVLIFITLVGYLLNDWWLSLFNATDVAAYRWYIPALITLMSFRELFFYILQGLERFYMYAFVQTASALLKVTLIGIFAGSLNLATLIWIEFAMLISSLLVQLGIIPFQRLSSPRLLFERSIIPKIMQFGFPLYVNSVLVYISNFGAVFIVGAFLNPVSIAAYEVARKIPEGFMRLFTAFQVVYFPSSSSLFAKGDLKNAQKLMNKSLVLLATGIFAIVLGGLLFSHEIITVVFSDRYLDVQAAFILILLAVCLHLLSNTMGFSLVSAGYPERSTKVNVIAMGAELLLSLLLIPNIGYIGAAYSYIMMTAISHVLSYRYLRQAKVAIDLQAYTRPFILLITISSIYLVAGNQNFIWRTTLLSLYIVLSIVFIPDCRQAIVYLRGMAQEMKLQRQA